MVKKPETKKPKKLIKARPPMKGVASGEGPVTLDEARAIVQATRPVRAARKAAIPPPTPESVGIARERLNRDYLIEIRHRADEYDAVISVMQKRGARAPQHKRATRSKKPSLTKASEGFVPLKILAEGDSWFDYPVPLFGGGIIPRLEQRLGVPIFSLAKAGDEVRYMLGVEQRQLLSSYLYHGSSSGGKFDALLFSGGGNDIVGDPMAIWIKDWDPTKSPEEHINQRHFDAAISLVRAGYEELIDLRDQLSPNTHLFFHGYDFAIPDGRGICHLGPWLKPTLDLRGFPELPNDPRKFPDSARIRVVNALLKQFSEVAKVLAGRPKVTFINTQGTLVQRPSSWHNELHPSAAGFDKFADIFKVKIKETFRERVAP